MTSFDSLPSAFLSIFQCITLEGWTEMMYQVQDAYSTTIPSIYFFLLILVGAFFMINFTLAVLYQSFLDAQLASRSGASTAGAVHAFSTVHACDDVLEALADVHAKSPATAKLNAESLMNR